MALNPMIATNLTPFLRGRFASVLLLAGFLLLSACSQENSPQPSTPVAGTASEVQPEVYGDIEFPISGELTADLSQEQEVRALNATVSPTLNAANNGRHAITLPARIPVICIIRSDQGDPATYHNLEAVRQGNTTTYRVERERVKLLAGTSLAAKKKWYIMFVAGGSYQQASRKITLDMSATETVNASRGARAGMDFVMATPWAPIPLWPNGYPKWPKDWSEPEIAALKKSLHPLGVLCRATLRLDQAYSGASASVAVNELKVVTTGVSFKGEFDLSAGALPPVTSTSGTPQLKWTNTQAASSKKEYPSTDARVNEYVKTFKSASGGSVLSVSNVFSDTGVNSNAQKQLSNGVQALLFWAMPVPGVSAEQNHTTLIAVSGTSTGKPLAPQYTYIYGKKHSKVASSGRAVYFDAVYYHPYTPLDYMAEYNMSRKDPDQWRVGGAVPPGLSNAWATDHGRNAFTAARLSDVTDGNGRAKFTLRDNTTQRNFILPTVAQWQSIIPFRDGSINVRLASNIVKSANDVSLEVQLGPTKSNTTYSARKSAGTEVMYALALTGFDNSNKRRVAYRYSMQPNPTPIDNAKGLQIPFEGGTFSQGYTLTGQKREVNYTSAASNRIYMKVEAVHLGESFVGSVDDIANENFWAKAVRKEERYLSINYNFFGVITSAAGGGFENLTPTLYTFIDTKDYVMVFSRDVRNWWYYDPPAFRPARVTEAPAQTKARMNALRVAVRPFTTQEHP